MVEKSIILAFTAVSALLPSVATVRVQRKEQDQKQLYVLGWCGLVALMVIIGALSNSTLMWFGIALMVLTYLFFLLAPKEMI